MTPNDLHVKSHWYELDDEQVYNMIQERCDAVLNDKMDIMSSEMHDPTTATATASSMANYLWERMQTSLNVINHALDQYDHLSISFNGGKDSVVMLHLILWAIHRRLNTTDSKAATIRETCSLAPRVHDESTAPQRDHHHASLDNNNNSNNNNGCRSVLQSLSGKDIIVFHFGMDNEFREMEQFIADTGLQHGFDQICIDGRMGHKAALEQIVSQFPRLQVVFMGVRRVDPFADHMEHFEKTTPGWPELMRVNVVLDWTYHEIWHFLLTFDISYCSLYDEGYTSLGCVHNTIKNKDLLVRDPVTGRECYKPAYMLRNASSERDSRLPRSTTVVNK